MPRQEERQSQRTKIDRLTYIELPSGNGGIVKDISEGGLGFCAVAPLEAPKAIPVTIRISSSGVVKRIKVTADLAWTDDSRKCGGLRFTELPDASRAQIRSWQYGSARQLKTEEPAPVSPAGPLLFPTPPIVLLEPKNPPQERAKKSAPIEHSKLVRIISRRLPQPVADRAAKTLAGTRRPSLQMVAGVAILAGVVGFMSNGWYREMRGRFTSRTTATSKTTGATERDSYGLTRVLASSKAPAPAAPVPPMSIPAVNPGNVSAADSAVQQHSLETTKALAVAPVVAKPASDSRVAFFFVQVGTYAKEAEAQDLVEKLRRQRFVAYAAALGDSKLYRVQLGPYTTDEAADLTQGALQKAGFDSYVRESGTSN